MPMTMTVIVLRSITALLTMRAAAAWLEEVLEALCSVIVLLGKELIITRSHLSNDRLSKTGKFNHRGTIIWLRRSP